MKTKLIIGGVLILIILLYMYLTQCYNKLPELQNYRVYSDKGLAIPAKLYKRVSHPLIDNKTVPTDEILICFDDSLINNRINFSGDEKLHKYLVIIPKLKMIGFVEHPSSFKVKEKYICQTDDKADKFTSVINNHTFFKNPPINKSVFTEKKVSFNTYGILKNFGNEINIEYDLNDVEIK